MAAGLRPRLRLDVPGDGTPILGDPTYPEHVARWDQPAPDPVAAPTALPTGLRPQLALDVPGGREVPLAPGANVPSFLTDPPPDMEPAPEDDVTPPPVPPPAETEPPPVAPPPGASAAPGAVKVETERTVLSPESKAAHERGQQLSGQQATQADTLARAQKAKAAAETRQQQGNGQVDNLQAQYDQRLLEEGALKQELAEIQGRQAQEKARQKTDRAEKAVDAANAEAGKDYWADKSTGYKILQALLTFSSIKSSYTLGQDPNDSPFMRMTREAVAADKDKKMHAVRASKEFLEAARRGPEEARQFLLDARADIDVSTNRQLQISLKKAEAFKASRKVDPAQLKANLDAANAQIDSDRLTTQQGLVDRDIQRTALTNRKVTTTAAPLTAAQMKAAGAGGQDPRLLVTWNGRDYPVRNLTDGTQLRKKAGASATLLQKLDAYAAVVDRIKPGPTTHGAELSELTTAKAKLLGSIKEADELGALDKGVRELVDEQLSDPTSIKTKYWRGGYEGTLTGVRSVREGVVQTMDNALNAQGNDVRTGGPPATGGASAVKLQAAIVKAAKAGDTAAVADLRARLRALGN